MVAQSFHPDQILQDAIDFNRKMADGFISLSKIKDVQVGASPKEAVYKEDKMVLYHFVNDNDNVEEVPLLIVYALVNRPYMTDLQKDRSLIKKLMATGQDIYLIDWGYPDGADRYLDLDDYINGYIDRCVDFICKQHNLSKINLLGICQGGAFSLCYTALHQDKVANLITMVTPVDFQTKDNILSTWTRNLDIDLMVNTVGNIPGELLNWSFLALKPFRLTGQKYADMADIAGDPEKLTNFLRMEKWIFDSPDQAGEAFREFIKKFYQQNCFIKGGLEIGGEPVDLKNISAPILNIYATEDHLVPPSASTALEGLTGTKDYSAITFKGGHIGIYVSGRSQKELPPAISDWLKERSS